MEDKDKRREARKRWYAKNKEKHNENTRANYERYRKIPRNRARLMLTWIQSRSKKCGYEFDLDLEFILGLMEKGKCEVTGLEFDFNEEKRRGARLNPYGPSMDRIDPSRGYTKDNCRMVVWIYNMAKSEWDDATVIGFARALIESQERKS